MALARRPPYDPGMGRPAIGDLIREWRTRRHRSQLDLAVDVGVSTRHLSFVETGRSRPSPELVLAIATHLDVPLRERNSLLLAAGYAPRFSHRSLDDAEMAPWRTSIQRMLDAHQPYPGVAVDRQWNVVLANEAAMMLTIGVSPEVLTQPLNVYRLTFHPDGLADRLLNLTDLAAVMMQQLRRSCAITGDPALQTLLDEVLDYPNIQRIRPLLDIAEHSASYTDPPLLIPFRLATPLGEVNLFTTLTTFGTPMDVTLDELAIELFYPSDDRSADVLRDLRSATAR